MTKPITRDNFVPELYEKKKRGEPIVMLTAYDAPIAHILERSAAVDLILVGDSVGMVVQGKSSTRTVTLEQMLYHTEMVAAGSSHTPIIGDLPYHSFETPKEALENARLFMKFGAWAVKFEGANKEAARALADEGIPLMGHLGLLPQTAENFSVRGKDKEEADAILHDAKELEQGGAFSLVLESIPRGLAKRVSESVSIPTIGIGAGPDCDGQVLVTYDMLGLTMGKVPKFVKLFGEIGSSIEGAVQKYSKEVRQGFFPSDRQSFH